jgi:uncharacterized repeat protein (TIGR03803 family)
MSMKTSKGLAVLLLFLAGGVDRASGQTLTTLHLFDGTDGNRPDAGLVEGRDGYLYGTTYGGGYTNLNGGFGYGTVFRISPSGDFKNLHSFSVSDGVYPEAALVRGNDGNFYGTTEAGGTSTNCGIGCGTVFRISPGGDFTNLHSFSGSDGSAPRAGLAQGSDGDFYGTTYWGGANGDGTVFRISPKGNFTSLHSFSGDDGNRPDAGLVQGSNSNFYGTTQFGGTSTNCGGGCGTVFRISPGGSLTNLHSFAGYPTDGAEPQAGLIQASDGSFYGTTPTGGASNAGTFGVGAGTVFRITADGDLTNLHSFAFSDGTNPKAGLVQGNDGNFYGTTPLSGLNGAGTVFRISPTGDFTNLYSFCSVTDTNGNAGSTGDCHDGADSQGSLVQGKDGDFYGTTYYGGIGSNGFGYGTVFRLEVPQMGISQLTFSFTNVKQTCRTKTDKKRDTTNITCRIAFDMVVANTGMAKSAKSSILFWPGQGSTFNPTGATAPIGKVLNAMKGGKKDTINIKSKNFIGDQAGTFIFATDAETNILAFVEVPGPE